MCTSPLKGWTKNDRVVKVSRSDVTAVIYDFATHSYVKYYDEPDRLPDGVITTYIDIPCRSCLECYNQMRKEWISRAVAESQCHDSMIFLTLTYSDDKLPISEMIDEDTGEIFKHSTLRYIDFQLFMKSLRKDLKKRLNKTIRFMVCGEYGTHTYRPHYHAIIYGCSLDDFNGLDIYSRNSHGDILYTCEDLERIWGNGYVVCSGANTNTIAYVAGYVAKKSDSIAGRQFYKNANIVPPFIRASNRPGLGYEWFSSHSHKFSSVYDYVSVPTDGEPVKIRLTPRWKEKWEEKFVYDPLNLSPRHDIIVPDEYLTDYKKSKINRRVDLLDDSFIHLDTDMTKDDYNYSKNLDLKCSSKRKRGVY